MMSELAFDQWKVTEESIAKRVDRYETKARWKKQYGSPSLSPRSRSREKSMSPRSRSREKSPNGKGKGKAVARNIPGERPRAYSVSVSRTPLAVFPEFEHDQENVPFLSQDLDLDLDNADDE